MPHIFKHVKSYRWLLVAIVFLSVMQIGSGLLTPTILASLISEGILKENPSQIYFQGALMFIASSLDLILSVLNVYLIGKFTAGLSRDLRDSLFKKIQHFSTQDFQTFGTTSYINRTTRDVQTLSQTMGFAMSMSLIAPLMFIFSIVLSIRINLQLSLVLLTAIPVLLLAIVLLIRLISKDFSTLRQFTDKLSQIIRESLTGIRVIRAFNKQQYELDRFDDTNKAYKKLLFGINIKFSVIFPIMMITINFASLAVVLVGARLIQAHQLQIGELMAVTQYSSLVLISMLMLSFVFIMIPQGLVAANRINAVLAQENIQTFTTENRGLSNITHIAFNNVSFKYEGAEKEMLSNVSLTAQTGEKIAIIGSTGAGKSTLMNLLLRFFDATSGQILYNGQNILDYSEKELRQQLALVPQTRNLFAGTIRENLKFGNENASDEDMINALKLAQAWEFVSQLDGQLDARVEQKGENFSGGQKQRLAIARALVKNASVHIFDDSFSALDAKTEAQLRHNLKQLNQQAIVFVVAQRITSVTDANKIIVLHEGKLVGLGTHDELKENNAIYQSIMASQSSLEEREDSEHA